MEVRHGDNAMDLQVQDSNLILNIISHALNRIQVSLLSVILRAMAKYTKLTFVNITTEM